MVNAPAAHQRQFQVRMIGETISAAKLRASITDVVHRAIRGSATYITSNGRRVAAVVPLAIAEAADPGEAGASTRQEPPAGE